MNVEPSQSIIVAGMQKTGKSTFLAALWHVLEFDELPESLKLVEVNNVDRTYINNLHSKWLNCESLTRTSTETTEPIDLSLKNPQTGRQFSLVIPDIAGEYYKRLFENRQLTKEFGARLVDATHILFFVNPAIIKDPVSNVQPNQTNTANHQKLKNEENMGNLNPPTEKDWHNRECNDQVKIVDLLQLIAEWAKCRLKLGIIVSAWDCLDGLSISSPLEYLEGNLPFVHQFLLTNSQSICWRVFGVSAQGGIYNKSDNSALHEFHNPSQRIRLRDHDQSEELHDITLPLRWLVQKN